MFDMYQIGLWNANMSSVMQLFTSGSTGKPKWVTWTPPRIIVSAIIQSSLLPSELSIFQELKALFTWQTVSAFDAVIFDEALSKGLRCGCSGSLTSMVSGTVFTILKSRSKCQWFVPFTFSYLSLCRGLEHTQAGYMIGAATTFKYSFDYHDDDIYWCTADCGWITGALSSMIHMLLLNSRVVSRKTEAT